MMIVGGRFPTHRAQALAQVRVGALRVRPQSRSTLCRAGMFNSVTRGIESAWQKVSGTSELTAENIKDPLKDIRRALLEADVSLPVVRRFVKKVEQGCIGTSVIRTLKPEQQLVKVVRDSLQELMGSEESDLNEAPQEGSPQIVLLAGLQGTGKTTAAGKLAKLLQKRGKSVLLAATDVYRPAAIEQLQKLGAQLEVEVYQRGTDADPRDVAAEAVEKAQKEGIQAVIVDTAGRLQIDDDLMTELRDIQARVQPTDTLLVVDAMTGQEAATLTKTFDEQVPLTGSILTKTDGDSRGGAALSVREVSGKPIKFMGTGEGLEAIEVFYPKRMAERILNMGDVLSLVEKAQESISQEDLQDIMSRVAENKFDLRDYRKMLRMQAGMGPLGKMASMIPGMSSMLTDEKTEQMERRMQRHVDILDATPAEVLETPKLLMKEPFRRRQIAIDSGYSEEDVLEMAQSFEQARDQQRGIARIYMQTKAMDPNMSKEEKWKALMLNNSQSPPGPTKARRRKSSKAKAKAVVGKGFGKA